VKSGWTSLDIGFAALECQAHFAAAGVTQNPADVPLQILGAPQEHGIPGILSTARADGEGLALFKRSILSAASTQRVCAQDRADEIPMSRLYCD